jgi:hypothetical protein
MRRSDDLRLGRLGFGVDAVQQPRPCQPAVLQSGADRCLVGSFRRT